MIEPDRVGDEWAEALRKRSPWDGVTPSACVAIELVEPGTCPACGGATADSVAGREPLFWVYGSGAVEVSVVRRCTSCWWSMKSETRTANPRRAAR